MPTFNNGEGLDSVRTKINAAIEKVDGTSPITSADINGGTIDGTVIGGVTPAAGTFSSATVNGNITVTGTVDGRDVAADGTKLDGIEAGADVTDTANVTAAGALMDSELTNITAVKALDQGVSTTDSPSFAGGTFTGNVSFGDNDKAIFGAGSDLQIYHDGTTNKIVGSIDVTGTVTADGLTVSGSADADITRNAAAATDNVELLSLNADYSAATTNGSFGGYLAFKHRTGGNVLVEGAQIGVIGEGANTSDLYIRTSAAPVSEAPKNRIKVDNTGDISFYEDTGTTPKFFWDASAESLGIGTSSASAALHLEGTTTVAQRTVRLAFDGTYYANIYQNGSGGLEYQTYGGLPHIWYQAGTERMRIDSSGNLLVGKTAADNTTAGGSIFAGVSSFVNDGARALTLVRNTSDGDIVEFRKGGTTVGSIGVKDLGGAMGPRLYLGNTDTGLFFQGETNNAITPCQGDSGATLDNSISLGSSSARFKDLYLSGGVYLGGTGAANKLDDYEEGTWTPDVVGTATAGTGTYAVRTGKYTKVGNLVTVFGSYDLTAHTGSGDLRIDGLPFTAANESNLYTIGQWSSNNLTLDAIAVQVYVFSNTNTDYLTVSQVRNAASNLPVVLDAAHAAWFSISYYV